MKAETLLKTVLGNCELQRLIGRGGLGAVYLAQQSHPDRQVAVKVFSPATGLKPDQLATFLERFRREIDVASSLEHPNILPVYEFGEQDDIIYLVMPYISGGTLGDVLKREGKLPLPRVVSYLEQIAAAVDYAHEQGIIHRDIKPANILLTSEDRLLLTDFGLVKVMTEGQAMSARLTQAGMSMGTPDYMAPEQILGSKVDERSDIYSLGVILYEMVTGTVPFHSDTPMQIAVKHLRIPPQPPRLLCPHLPPAAEQVMLQALAKRSTDRYSRAQDLAAAFRLALTVAGVELAPERGQVTTLTSTTSPSIVGAMACPRPDTTVPRPETAIPRPDTTVPHPETAVPRLATVIPHSDTTIPRISKRPSDVSTRSIATASPKKYRLQRKKETTDVPQTFPTVLPATDPITEASVQASVALNIPETETSQVAQLEFPEMSTSTITETMVESSPTSTSHVQSTDDDQSQKADENAWETFHAAFAEQPTGKRAAITTVLPRETETDSQEMPAVSDNKPLPSMPETPLVSDPISPLPDSFKQVPEGSDTTTAGAAPPSEKMNSVKLSAPLKVVQVPLAGQPGVFVTGLLPVLPEMQPEKETRSFLGKRMRILAFIAAVLFIVLVPTAYWLVSSHSSIVRSPSSTDPSIASNMQATRTAQISATLEANTILFDPLSQNIHNWPVATTGSKLYIFENGAYHIIDNDPKEGAPAILADQILQQSFGYTLTMEEIQGDDTSINNAFGLIVRFNNSTRGGKVITTFYSFEVVNRKGGEYQFWKYDNSQPGGNPWKQIWHHAFGPEFHEGHGPSAVNTLKIFVNGKNFTLIVNGRQITMIQDGSIASGGVGMLVNLKGTEVAFSNLRLTTS